MSLVFGVVFGGCTASRECMEGKWRMHTVICQPAREKRAQREQLPERPAGEDPAPPTKQWKQSEQQKTTTRAATQMCNAQQNCVSACDANCPNIQFFPHRIRQNIAKHRSLTE